MHEPLPGWLLSTVTPAVASWLGSHGCPHFSDSLGSTTINLTCHAQRSVAAVQAAAAQLSHAKLSWSEGRHACVHVRTSRDIQVDVPQMFWRHRSEFPAAALSFLHTVSRASFVSLLLCANSDRSHTDRAQVAVLLVISVLAKEECSNTGPDEAYTTEACSKPWVS